MNKKEPKLYLVGMSGPNSLEDLKELIEPVKDSFDGIVWTLHDSVGSAEEDYLNSVKKCGKVINYYYHKRHDQSRNQYLWCGPMKNGDWFVQVDLLERIPKEFAEQLKPLINSLLKEGINALFYFQKAFIIRYHESLIYRGTPHEGLMRQDGQMVGVEMSNSWTDESLYRYSVRNSKRKDPYQWVNHYCKYFLFGYGSNHALLGLENRGDPNVLFPKRETLRLEFLDELEKRGFERTPEDVIKMFSEGLDDRLKYFVNNEKVWQDVYRYYVLGDTTVQDEHNWTSMKQF